MVGREVDRVDKWMLDSGASHHIISTRAIVNPQERIRKRTPLRMDTANGSLRLDEEVETSIPALQITALAIVKSGNTNVLSLGRLIEQHGCAYAWVQGHTPRLWDATGAEIRVWIENNVPFIDPLSTPVTPATANPLVQVGGSSGSSAAGSGGGEAASPTAAADKNGASASKGGGTDGATSDDLWGLSAHARRGWHR